MSESATLMVAIHSIKNGARAQNMSFLDYGKWADLPIILVQKLILSFLTPHIVKRGHDPTVNVVLLEDLAAVLGVVTAGACMAAASHWNSPMPDAVGSLLVGGLLGVVASFIIHTNTNALLGRSIPIESIQQINSELEADLMVRAVHDVKGIDMGKKT